MKVKNVMNIIDIESDMFIEDMKENDIDIEEAVNEVIEVIVIIAVVNMSVFIVVDDERNDVKRGKRQGEEDDKNDLMSLVMSCAS